MSVSDFPVEVLRRHFPASRSTGSCVFFDNAAGAQVPVRRHGQPAQVR